MNEKHLEYHASAGLAVAFLGGIGFAGAGVASHYKIINEIESSNLFMTSLWVATAGLVYAGAAVMYGMYQESKTNSHSQKKVEESPLEKITKG